MDTLAETRMTVEQYLIWAEDRPGRYELEDGVVYKMAPERSGHAKTKLAFHVAFLNSIKSARLCCHVVPDGMAVQIDARTAYEPDAMVYCGVELDDDDLIVPNPVILVEVLSPSTQPIDRGAKLAAYFSIPSVHHYLIADIRKRLIIHHNRNDNDAITTRIVSNGDIEFDPPGFSIAYEAIF